MSVYKSDTNNHLESTDRLFTVTAFPWAIRCFTFWDLTYQHCSLLSSSPPRTSVSLPATSPVALSCWQPSKVLVVVAIPAVICLEAQPKEVSFTPYLNSRDTHTLQGFSIMKSIPFPPLKDLQALICSNPLILQIETQNWSDFQGCPAG